MNDELRSEYIKHPSFLSYIFLSLYITFSFFYLFLSHKNNVQKMNKNKE